MQFTFYDKKLVTKTKVKKLAKSFEPYAAEVQKVVDEQDTTRSEYSLALWKDQVVYEQAMALADVFKKCKHVILIGTGGSSLGVEAVHSVLAQPSSPSLHVLDTASAYELDALLQSLAKVKKVADIAVCVISKSGGTTETLSNTEILLGSLEERFGADVYQQTIFISDPKTPLQKIAMQYKSHFVAMPTIVGGRFSVATAAGLVPMALLGHDIDAYLAGYAATLDPHYETVVKENAARTTLYIEAGYAHHNIFVFDTRLVRLAKWYRQLSAESLGKAINKKGKKVKGGMLPTITTPVELHSVGQFYFSDVVPVYTDFVTFDDDQIDFMIPGRPVVAKKFKKKSLQDINAAMYAGVIKSYQSTALPYRSTIFDEELTYSLGMFMSMKILEVMYVASHFNINAFDQPNVESYKKNTLANLNIS